MNNEITITIPGYIRKVLLSKSRNKKFYEKGKKKLPKKYQDIKKYGYKAIKLPNGQSKVRLVLLQTNEPVISNPRSVGTEKWKVINGQSIYNGQVHTFERAKMINAIKDSFRPYLKDIKPITQCPVKITYIFHDDFLSDARTERKDLDNHAFVYGKCFQDLLVDEGILPDDSTEFVTGIEYIYDLSKDGKSYLHIKIKQHEQCS
jgi:aspartyl/asparaginyl beta-hydroxylase (cupin superfamily)